LTIRTPNAIAFGRKPQAASKNRNSCLPLAAFCSRLRVENAHCVCVVGKNYRCRVFSCQRAPEAIVPASGAPQRSSEYCD